MNQNISEVVKVETIEEANTYLKKGWALLDSKVFESQGAPSFIFLIGKTSHVLLEEMIEEFNSAVTPE